MRAGDVIQHLSDPAKHTIDALSIGALLGVLFQWVTPIAAVGTLIWTVMRIYEAALSIRDKRLAIKIKERELADG